MHRRATLDTVTSWFARRAAEWLKRRAPAASRCELDYRRIFILPTGSGLMFVLIACLVFLIAVNYVISLAFALAFLMVALFIVHILHTFRNLHGVVLSAAAADPVYAGQSARFAVRLRAAESRGHRALQLKFRGGNRAGCTISSLTDRRTVELALQARRRGLLRAPRLRIETDFPLGLCRAWADTDLAMSCLVYPEPREPPQRHLRALPGDDADRIRMLVSGGEEFAGLRDYQRGDAVTRIAWKSLAGRQQLQVKQFQGNAGQQLQISWQLFPGVPAELRLSYLCYLVLRAERHGMRYGLVLPGESLRPGSGPGHKRNVLERLALWRQ